MNEKTCAVMLIVIVLALALANYQFMGSASLEQFIPYEDGSAFYWYWLCSFLGHALEFDQSVNEALNTASLQFMGLLFGDTELRTGFTAYWRNFPLYYGNTLAIYGNGNMHLQDYTPPSDVATPRFVSGSTAGYVDIS
jgi:hypothetical protein